MLILTIRTDKPEAEIGLFDGNKKLAYKTWHAHRQLAETIHTVIKELLESQGKQLSDLTAIVVYQGPGSFTGLRIGITVANALGYGLSIPVAGATGDDWIVTGTKQVASGKLGTPVLPEYGAPVHITTPKK